MRRINEAGLELIKNSEGLRLSPYLCPAGLLTIGYGHVIRNGEVIRDLDEEAAELLLQEDVRWAEKAVGTYVKVPLTENQFSALVSFIFNIGCGAFQKSTLLKLLNKSDYDGASKEFAKWNKGGGKVLPGLIVRRSAERELFDA